MKHTITVTKRSDDYMAYLDGDTAMWGCGKSPYEAIGSLISSHQPEVGITIQAEVKPMSRQQCAAFLGFTKLLGLIVGWVALNAPGMWN